MADYFSKHASTVCECLSDLDAQTALELGSGNGFLSVCFLASLQQQQSKRIKELVITDLQEHLPLIRRTLNANRHIHFVLGADGDEIRRDTLTISAADESHDAKDSIVVNVTQHAWGNIEGEPRKFDFIFGTDVAYRDELHAPLIQSLLYFSHPRTIILLGVTMNDTKPIFFDALWNAGFTYVRMADNNCMMPEYRGNTFGLFVIQKRPN